MTDQNELDAKNKAMLLELAETEQLMMAHMESMFILSNRLEEVFPKGVVKGISGVPLDGQIVTTVLLHEEHDTPENRETLRFVMTGSSSTKGIH